MKVNINGTEVELVYTMRSLMVYEKVYGKTFQPEGLTEIMVYFYSTVLASAKNLQISFDDFIEWIDENPQAITDFSEWLTNVTGVNKYVTNLDSTGESEHDPNV